MDSELCVGARSDEKISGILSPEGILKNAIVVEKGGGTLTKYTSAGNAYKTLYDTFNYGVARNPESDCLGKRKDIESPYVFQSYKKIQEEAKALGAYMNARLDVIPNDRVGLSGKNAPEYLTAINGCFFAGATTVPIYDTFGHTECQYIMDQAQVKVVFVSKDNAEQIATWSETIQSVQKIIVWGADDTFQPASDKIITYEDAVKEGMDLMESTEPKPPTPTDLAIIMYTSGTTGKPKGVMLTHEALVATVASTEQYFHDYGYPMGSNDVFMSYLPLAHVFDFFSENLYLFLGAKIGYYRGDQKTLVDDIGELKPTVFVGVPRVFDKIYKRVSGMIQGGSSIKKFLFNTFYDQKNKNMNNGISYNKASFLGDALVFSKVKARLGGRVRIICSGGAPLAQHVEEFLRVTMCCPVVQGYGLTETCAASCVAMPGASHQLGTVGPPLFSMELKLDPVQEMGYDGSAEGGGEICFRGPSVMKGYYQNPEATSEVLDDDGWFHTGDIGKIVTGGCLRIVDRKKQLFKLSQGEYVSPEKVEGIANKSSLVSQIFVHGTSTESVLVAVVVPSVEALKKYNSDITSPELKAEILKDLNTVCRSEGLKGYEIPKGVILHSDEFTPESGFVTPSFKLKRPFLRKHFEAQIQETYAELNK